MKVIKRFLIIIAIVFLANYIVNIQTDEQNYAYKNPEFCPAQNLRQYSILKHGKKEVLRANDIIEMVQIPLKTNFAFAKVKVIFVLTKVPVFHWQLARGNINSDSPFYRTKDMIQQSKTEQMFCYRKISQAHI